MILVVCGLLSACGQEPSGVKKDNSVAEVQSAEIEKAGSDELFQILDAISSGLSTAFSGVAGMSEQEFYQKITDAEAQLAFVESKDWSDLNEEQRLHKDLLIWDLKMFVEGKPYYWHSFDITGYNAAMVLGAPQQFFTTAPLGDEKNQSVYLAQLENYARVRLLPARLWSLMSHRPSIGSGR